jgi:hypothetical protein
LIKEIHSDIGVIEVWLSKNESSDSAVQDQLRQIYVDGKSMGYKVAVFLSGEENLCQMTSALLCYNRRRIAEIETEKEKSKAVQ